MSAVMWLMTIYGIGVLVGLLLADGNALTKVTLAVLWPLGPLAFGATVAALLGVAAIAFPLFGVAILLAVMAALMLW